MKSYEEMASSALTRIEIHKEKQRIQRKKAAKIAAPLASLCIAALIGIGLYSSGALSRPAVFGVMTEDVNRSEGDGIITDDAALGNLAVDEANYGSAGENNGVSSEKNDGETSRCEQVAKVLIETDVTEDTCDMLGTVTKDGRLYVQIEPDREYTKGKYLGLASDFDGRYKGYTEVRGYLYESVEDENILIIILDNGGTVVLKADDNGGEQK